MEIAAHFFGDRYLQLEFRMIYLATQPLIQEYIETLKCHLGGQDRNTQTCVHPRFIFSLVFKTVEKYYFDIWPGFWHLGARRNLYVGQLQEVGETHGTQLCAKR